MHFERLVLYIRFYICTIFTSKIDNFEISKLVGVLEADAKKDVDKAYLLQQLTQIYQCKILSIHFNRTLFLVEATFLISPGTEHTKIFRIFFS